MRLRTWVGMVAVIFLTCEGVIFVMNKDRRSCPQGERIRAPMPFANNGGRAWTADLPELAQIADNEIAPNRSPIAICENDRALGPAHALHRDIRDIGEGRFSHWGHTLHFSTSDNSDPNATGRSYLLIRPEAAIPVSAPVLSEPPQQTISKDMLLVDVSRMTLYTFDKDSNGKSTCNGNCLEFWRPYDHNVEMFKPSATGHWSSITRDDGTKMWSYKGKPVYYFRDDKAPGDVNGDGVNGVWHIVTIS